MSKPKERGAAAAKKRNIRGSVKAKAIGLMTKVEPIKKVKRVELKTPVESPRPGA